MRLLPHGLHGLLKRGREGAQEVYGLAYVPVDRRDLNPESCREADVSVAAAQVSEDEQGLPTASKASPAGTDAKAVTCEKRGAPGQHSWTGRWRTGREARELLPDW